MEYEKGIATVLVYDRIVAIGSNIRVENNNLYGDKRQTEFATKSEIRFFTHRMADLSFRNIVANF